MDFANVYEDTRRAAAYANLEFPGTYYLAYRDLPDIIINTTPVGMIPHVERMPVSHAFLRPAMTVMFVVPLAP